MTASLNDVRPFPTSDAIIPLDTHLLSDVPCDVPVVPLQTALTYPQTPSDVVRIHVPPYRPASALILLAALAGRLGRPGSRVVWFAQRKYHGHIRRTLVPHGWRLVDERVDGTHVLTGTPPVDIRTDHPHHIAVTLGAVQTNLAADYGVFSTDRLDDGTELLLTTALAMPPVPTVADIGTGYGPLALGMVLNGAAQAAVASDIDAFALHLADINARRLKVPLVVSGTPDPARLPPTPLTLCNVPTHIPRDQTGALMDGLATRAQSGPVLLVVHRSLEGRYHDHMHRRGLCVTPRNGEHHVVLRVTSPSAPPLAGTRLDKP